MKLLKKYLKLYKDNGLITVFIIIFNSVILKICKPVLKFYYTKLLKITDNKIIFCSGADFSDNSRILYEFLLKTESLKKMSFVWLVREDVNFKEDHTRFFISNSKWHVGYSLKALKEIYTSQYLFFTHESPVFTYGEKKGQTVVNLWHGCGYKDRVSKIPWIKNNPFDIALVPGNIFVETKAHFWGCSKDQIVPIGYPRYDLFKRIDDEAEKFYFSLKGENDFFIMWMPTYRKTKYGQFGVDKINGFYEIPLLTCDNDLQRLDEFCTRKKILLCIKRHPNQIQYGCESNSYKNIVFISNNTLKDNGIELYSILNFTDGLITDYSSIAIDYILLNKPIAFSLSDFDAYKDAQGFVFKDPMKYMPGNHLYCYDDLLNYFNVISNKEDPYRYRRQAIFPKIHNPCDNYCKRIALYLGLLDEKNNEGDVDEKI